MRTTLDIDADILAAAKELGLRQKRSLGKVISDLARAALTKAPDNGVRAHEVESFYGFEPLSRSGNVVTNAIIDALREETGD